MEEIDSKELLLKFEDDCKLRDMTKESIRSYISELKIFNDYCQKNNINNLQITNEVLEHFLQYLREERKISQSRIENYFSALSCYYDFLLYKGLTTTNIIVPFRKRYLKRYKKSNPPAVRKLITIEDMSRFVNSIIPIRPKAIAILLAKTGIRRGELLEIELNDVDFNERTIMLKPFHKRSNRLIFFDEETEIVLKKWMKRREDLVNDGVTTLYVNDYGEPIGRCGVYNEIVLWAMKLGYYDIKSDRLEDHFSCHNFRHWFTTYLLRNGMPREYVKELRGDIRNEAIDIYHHIDRKDLKRAYLAAIPKLNVY
ncbi:MAG: tyrosine-type recombinase/integrase [Thermoplasmata archaeon]|nr:tyrosine-type recombinase/integrase [Thermoplasmata archaeon]MBE3136163.1 tyrosine-type recombinase/integrase [Thermoplasmata archaeon]